MGLIACLLKNEKCTLKVKQSEGYNRSLSPCIKVGLSPSEKDCFIFFDESPLKMMKDVFYFTLKALFVLKIFKLLS